MKFVLNKKEVSFERNKETRDWSFLSPSGRMDNLRAEDVSAIISLLLLQEEKEEAKPVNTLPVVLVNNATPVVSEVVVAPPKESLLINTVSAGPKKK